MARFDELQKQYGDLRGYELVRAVLEACELQQVALLSAFNPEDVIISKWISQIAPETPILFLDTLKHFPETLRYVDEVIAQLGLTGVQTLTPDPQLLKNSDADGELWKTQVNRCCWLRKVEPIEREIERGDYKVLITGRRREQTPERAEMPAIEQDEKGRIKINPLFDWTREQREEAMEQLDLHHHPLYHLGYLSMGCAPCTTPIFAGEDERAGRWRHTRLNQADGNGQKTECGLHVDEKGQG